MTTDVTRPDGWELRTGAMEGSPMADVTRARELAEQWLLQRYGSVRGHPEWRIIGEAFAAGVSSELERSKRSLALVQQHQATAWNRGHEAGMRANRDIARQAQNAVAQDSWGNSKLTEALMAAEDERDSLRADLELANAEVADLHRLLREACGDGAAAELERAREDALREAWEAVSSMIVAGELPGNGTDKTAERNGLILAANAISQKIAAIAKEEGR